MEAEFPFIGMNDLYKAYRKAKTDAFYDRTHFNGIAFAAYEQQLEYNLNRLLKRLCATNHNWANDVKFIGGHSYLPKSIERPEIGDSRDIHYATLDPIVDWMDQCQLTKRKIETSFRQIITPTVNYLVVSALWIIKVGHKFDATIKRDLSYAHALRRQGNTGPIAEEAHNLFEPYIYGYRNWRSKGLEAMRNSLICGKSIVAVTMDVERFYHCASPNFLIKRDFHERLGVDLSDEEEAFNRSFVSSLNTWYNSTPDAASRPEGALPIGLSASRVISNVLLAEFDRDIYKSTKAIYYGRYADDIFLVVERPPGLRTGEQFVKWLRDQMKGRLVLQHASEGSGLRLHLPYAKDSQIVFSSKKQKIFYLDGGHGLDLVDQIVEKIKLQSSEYRDLPELPDTEGQMAAQALLASQDATLEADALRKAEAVSIRRLGFSMLLSDVEAYARDLEPTEWKQIRYKFYDLVFRYVLTPTGVFDYFVYIVRVFGLMVACGDIKKATDLLNKFDHVSNVLGSTTTAGTYDRAKYREVRRHYFRGFAQETLAASGGTGITEELRRLIGRIQRKRSTPSLMSVRSATLGLLKADLARRPYHDYWFRENRQERKQPRIPNNFSVRRVLAMTKKYRGRIEGGLNAPYWPAIAFATRPVPLWSLCLSAPALMAEPGGLEKLLWATRGSKVNARYKDFQFISGDDDGRQTVFVPDHTESSRLIGVPSYLTTDAQWNAAFSGHADKSLARYVGIRRLINRMLRESPYLRYIAFPECSIRYEWAVPIAQKLGLRGVSFIAGLENRGKGKNYTNDAFVALSSNFFGRRGAICFVQNKLALANREQNSCEKAGKIFRPGCGVKDRPVYIHGGLCISVLVCSDLTTIANRAYLQGAIDALFVLEWNRDLTTFEFLVESASHDLHASIVQINNREYGDSRIRMPFHESYRRDVVQVKGGAEDFYVVSSVDFASLREFQRFPDASKEFKPLPIGYKMSSYRRNAKLNGSW